MRRAESNRAVQPPLRGGINASQMKLPPGSWATVGQWAVERFGDCARELFDQSGVFYDYEQPANFDDPYEPGRRVWLFRPVPDEPLSPIQLNVAYRGEHFMVVEKPHEMATIPKASHVANSVLVAARRQFRNDLIVASHRLDYETAGLVLLTTDALHRGRYQKLFENRRITKTYFAVAPAIPGVEMNLWQRIELDMEKIPGYLQIVVRENGRNSSFADSVEYRAGAVRSATVHADGVLPNNEVADRVVADAELAEQYPTDHIAVRDVLTDDAVHHNAPRGNQAPESMSAANQTATNMTNMYGNGHGRNVKIALNPAVPPSKARSAHTVTDYRMIAVWVDAAGWMEAQHAVTNTCEPGVIKNSGAEPQKLALYELRPYTGFTHQLRVTMAYLGVPILGDPIYPRVLSLEETACRPFPLQLLAKCMDFVDPLNSQPMHIESGQRLETVPLEVWNKY